MLAYHMPSICVFALSYYVIRSLQPLCKLDSIIIPTLQTRKFGSEKLGNLPRVCQLVGDKAGVLANPRLSDARIEHPEFYTFFF